MKPVWLYLYRDDIEIEKLQCEQEGRDISGLESEFNRVLALDLEDPASQTAAKALLDATIRLPVRSDFPFDEPSDLEGIKAARPAGPACPRLLIMTWMLQDRIHGGWVGRCVGCLLGKPVEGWKRSRMWDYLKRVDRWPLDDFFYYDIMPDDMKKEYHPDGVAHPSYADNIDSMLEDDDINYTVSALATLKEFGFGFTPSDVGNVWLGSLPILRTCTAERVAYRNLSCLIPPPLSATYRNPYREWIGAQIRADFWGYCSPGNPEFAAELAWRDASISHTKNGIYGEMWVAAMIAAAFATADMKLIIRCGLAQIPARCRLAEAIGRVLAWRENGDDYDQVVERVHQEWDESRSYDWCHTIPNAMIVAIGLLWGEDEYGKTICRAVQCCFDTDCNGATAGSIWGAAHGQIAIPSRWKDLIEDTLHTGVAGYHTVNLVDMAIASMRAMWDASSEANQAR